MAQNAAITGPSTWTVEGTRLKLNGEDICLNGVCYSPTPKGFGIFSPQIGDWFYDKLGAMWSSDNSNDRGDLRTMRELGVNHLRTYFWWVWQWPTPEQENSIDWVKRRGWRDAGAATFDHTRFLDECQANGIHVMIGLAVNSGDIFESDPSLRPAYRELYVDTAREIGRRYGAHPAVMGLCVGNEQNQPGRNENPDFWAGLSEMSQAFRATATNKITMIAFQNDANLFKTKVNGAPLQEIYKRDYDAYGLNIYGDLNSSLNEYRSQVVEAEGGKWALPLIVSEWGVGGGKNVENPKYNDPAFNFPKTRQVMTNSGPEDVPIGPLEGPPFGIALAREFNDAEFRTACDNLRKYYGQIRDNSSFVAGSEYFAWSDEWWKNNTDQKLIEAIDNGSLRLDQWGRFASPWPMPPDFNGLVEHKIPTRITEQDAGASPDWPEEFWGLYALENNPNGPIGWTEYGYMYNADALRARPTVEALKEVFSQG